MKKLLSSIVAAGAIALGGCSVIDTVAKWAPYVYPVINPNDHRGQKNLERGAKTYEELREEQRRLERGEGISDSAKERVKRAVERAKERAKRSVTHVPMPLDVPFGKDVFQFSDSSSGSYLNEGILPEFGNFDVLPSDSLELKVSKISNQVLFGLGELGVYELATTGSPFYAFLAREVNDVLSPPNGEKRFAVLNGGELNYPASFTLGDKVFITPDLVELCFAVGTAYTSSKSRSEFDQAIIHANYSISKSDRDFFRYNHKFDDVTAKYAISCLAALLAREQYHASAGSSLKLLAAGESAAGLVDELNREADLAAVKTIGEFHKTTGSFDPVGVLLAMELINVADRSEGTLSRYSAVQSALKDLGYKTQLSWE